MLMIKQLTHLNQGCIIRIELTSYKYMKYIFLIHIFRYSFLAYKYFYEKSELAENIFPFVLCTVRKKLK